METVTLAAANLQGRFTTDYGLVMAGATVTFLVPLTLYVLLQRQFVEGVHSLQRSQGLRIHRPYQAGRACRGRDTALLEARPVMIHAQTVRDDQLDRMAPVGMIASIFSVHTWFWGDVHLRNFGPERGHRISPARSALDRGVRVTLPRTPPSTPPDLILTIWAA